MNPAPALRIHLPALALGALLAGCAAGPDPHQALTVGVDDLRAGAELRGQVAVAAGEHLAPAPAAGAVIRIEGRRGVELDLRGVVLRGQLAGSDPDVARGVCLELVDCQDVVVRGGTLSGYGVAVRLENCRDVTLEGISVQDGRAARLHSGPKLTDPDDALDLAPADGTRWLERYGAAIALVDCVDVDVRACRATRGQNGVVLVRALRCRVYDGEFHHLSGWGVALWNSDECVVSRNRLDACVRGALAGPHADGCGSAAILVSGRAMRNTYAFNRAVGAGAGARVVPGATPGAESGDGLWYGNHFAPVNGPGISIAGGSGHRVAHNRVEGAQGAGIELVGAASGEVFANAVEDVRGAGLALRGGAGGLLADNRVVACDRGIELTGDGAEPRTGGALLGNLLRDNGLDVVLDRAERVEVADNDFEGSSGGLDLSGLHVERGEARRTRWAWLAIEGHVGATGRAAAASLARPGVSARSRLRELRFEGPPSTPGSASAVVGGELDLLATPHMTPFGPRPGMSVPGARSTPASGGLLAGQGFSASWFRFDAGSDPRADLEAWRALRFDPLERGRLDSWSDPWGDPARRQRVGPLRFGLIATGEVQVERGGPHVLDVISDDGLRVQVDGVVVYEDWTWHPARPERVELELAAGVHALVIEYFQLDGAAELALSLDPARTE